MCVWRKSDMTRSKERKREEARGRQDKKHPTATHCHTPTLTATHHVHALLLHGCMRGRCTLPKTLVVRKTSEQEEHARESRPHMRGGDGEDAEAGEGKGRGERKRGQWAAEARGERGRER
jgi:hypothetical protein